MVVVQLAERPLYQFSHKHWPKIYFLAVSQRNLSRKFYKSKTEIRHKCSEGKTFRLIKRHLCLLVTFSSRPACQTGCRHSKPCSFSIFGTFVASTVTFCEHILFEIFVISLAVSFNKTHQI